MAAGVIIDIPGVGQVEAKNAATESTLRDILAAIRAQKSGGGAGGGAGGVLGALSGGAGGAVGKNLGSASKGALSFGNKLGMASKALTGMAGAAYGAIKAVVGFNGALAQMVGDMANVEDSLTAASSQLGIFSSMFGPAMQALEKSVSAYQQATASGATFGGSVNAMARAASGAGMTLSQFAGIIAQNGEAMRLLGGTTEEGARRFGQLSKQMRTGGYMNSLNTLGYTTQEVNEGMANYIRYLGQTGRIGGQTNAQLAASSAKYLKEMDMLAKITGETRKEQEAARQRLLNDAQYQAKISSMGTEAAEAFANTINGLPPGLRDVAKDIMVTGTATTEEAQKFSALMPRSAELMRQYAEITNRGGTITTRMQQDLQNLMRQEGQNARQQYQTQGMYNREMAGTYMQIVNSANIQENAIVNAARAQANAAAQTDGLAAAQQAAKRRLSELSNGFTMLLANSGMLSSMMNAFEMLASFVQNVVFPVFQALSAVINPFINILSVTLMPVFELLGNILRGVVVPLFQIMGQAVIQAELAFRHIIDGIEDFLRPAFNFLFRIVDSVAGAFNTHLWPAIQDVANFFMDTFKPVLDFVATPLRAIGELFQTVKQGFADFFNRFNTFSEIMESISIKFAELGLNLTEFWYTIKDLIPGLTDATEEEKAQLQRDREELSQRAQRHETRLFGNQVQNEAIQAEQERLRIEERARRDAAIAGQTYAAGQRSARALEGVAAQAEAARNAQQGIDYSSPEAMLRTFATQQQSSLVPSVPVGRVSSARPDGVSGSIRPGQETNALDAMAENRARASGFTPRTSSSVPAAPTEVGPTAAEQAALQREIAEAVRTMLADRNAREGANGQNALDRIADSQNQALTEARQLNTSIQETNRLILRQIELNRRATNAAESQLGDVFTMPIAP